MRSVQRSHRVLADDRLVALLTLATLALKAGADPKVVHEQLGHSSIAVRMDTYSHVPQAVERDSADKIAGLFGD